MGCRAVTLFISTFQAAGLRNFLLLAQSPVLFLCCIMYLNKWWRGF